MRPKTISDQEILEVVRSCVLDEGPAVSTQIIADQVGVSQATLFKRFGNKVHLITRALLLGVEAPNLIRALEAEVDRSDPQGQLLAMAVKLHAFFEKMVPGVGGEHIFLRSTHRILHQKYHFFDPHTEGKRAI